MTDKFIYKELKISSGVDGGYRKYIAIDTDTGESEIVLEQTVKLRLPVTEIKRIDELEHRLNIRSGRCCVTLADMADLADGRKLK